MKVLVLGGDGYLGWPTAMRLSAQGHEVMVVDNYLRRRVAREESVEPLFEVPELRARARRWKDRSSRDIEVRIVSRCMPRSRSTGHASTQFPHAMQAALPATMACAFSMFARDSPPDMTRSLPTGGCARSRRDCRWFVRPTLAFLPPLTRVVTKSAGSACRQPGRWLSRCPVRCREPCSPALVYGCLPSRDRLHSG